MLVQTTKGLIDSDELTRKYSMTLNDTAHTVATEWYLGDELVRRDVHVSVLRGLPVHSTAGKVT